ncbi:piggyBac transposable element-derived protein 3-like [Frankliniella occidentalis]|uniref:PiggyBac transposable element-derived protein 3-like n=1 Tax=Frankliniella occidentalis TaxID=133901 RepID=A0A9C6X2E4_FRAOC|nr:piggyBac transposable element-derived protein 3-like [Frankliniella occidentalis]
MNHDNNSSLHNVSASSNNSTGRTLRPKKVSAKNLYTVTSDEDEDEVLEETEDEVEWNVDDPAIINNCDTVESVISSGASSEDEQVKVTLPKTALRSKWSKMLAPKRNKNNLAESSNETNHWVREEIVVPNQEPVTIPAPDEDLRDPYAYFQYFFDDSLLESIVTYSNSYSIWKDGSERNLNLTKTELQQFLGVWMYMGVNTLPGIRDFWAADTLVNQVASIMSFNRFQKIRSHLHFFDKSQEAFLPAGDRFAKVGLILDHMKKKCNDLDQEKYYSIDETMVPYKGKFAWALRQFIRNKPHRFGIKIFNLAGTSGIVYDFLPYAGSETFRGIEFSPEEEALGVGAKVVLSLARSIHDPANKSVFFDNYFASVKLVRHLKDNMHLLSTGTVRNNRIDHCPLISDKELKSKGRGAYDFKSSDGVQVTKWMDNKIVHLVSSLSGAGPEGTAKRYDKASKRRINVPIPHVIQLYNNKMGGVDLSDMLVEILRSPTKARRSQCICVYDGPGCCKFMALL